MEGSRQPGSTFPAHGKLSGGSASSAATQRATHTEFSIPGKKLSERL